MNPRLVIDLNKLAHNASTLCEMCHAYDITVAVVTKVFCADPRLVEILTDLPIDFFADSRLENIESYPKNIPQRSILLRLPSPSEAMRTVMGCDISLNSEMDTLMRLSAAARSVGKRHGVILMVDMGDLREGIYHSDKDRLLRTVEFILSQKSLILEGLGVNLTCYGSVLPTQENLRGLCNIASSIRERYQVELPIISGGNSSSLYLLDRAEMPWEISNLRLGESVIRGVETAFGQHIPILQTDVVTLEAEIIELMDKPSKPEGVIGVNAFGEAVEYEDRGIRKRAILAVGRQDTNYEGLTPLEPMVEVVGASSDHLIVDVTDSPQSWAVGDVLRFSLSYGAILAGFTSPYVEKKYVYPKMVHQVDFQKIV